MKYIKCVNYNNRVSFVNVDKILYIRKSPDGNVDIITVNEDTFYTDNDSLKNPITLEKVAEIILQ